VRPLLPTGAVNWVLQTESPERGSIATTSPPIVTLIKKFPVNIGDA
jgi:hypothetical protein